MTRKRKPLVTPHIVTCWTRARGWHAEVYSGQGNAVRVVYRTKGYVFERLARAAAEAWVESRQAPAAELPARRASEGVGQ